MKKKGRIVEYTIDELKAMTGKSKTDWRKVDAMTQKELERIVARDEKAYEWDWTRAKLVLPKAKESVHLRLDPEVARFFKSGGKGHITRMQAVLKAYVDAQLGRRPPR